MFRVPMAMPTTMLMPCRADLRGPGVGREGTTIAATVARPMIQPKNSRGRGVVATRRWATPVAARAATNAVIA